MMAPYEGTLRVEVTAIVADDHDGFVAVKESAQRPSPGLAYTGVHVWGFREGRISGSRATTTTPTPSSGRRGRPRTRIRRPEGSRGRTERGGDELPGSR